MTKETTGIGTSARLGRCINSDDTNSRLAITLVMVCGFAGLALRYGPGARYRQRHQFLVLIGAPAEPFTNYTPFTATSCCDLIGWGGHCPS